MKSYRCIITITNTCFKAFANQISKQQNSVLKIIILPWLASLLAALSHPNTSCLCPIQSHAVWLHLVCGTLIENMKLHLWTAEH